MPALSSGIPTAKPRFDPEEEEENSCKENAEKRDGRIPQAGPAYLKLLAYLGTDPSSIVRSCSSQALGIPRTCAEEAEVAYVGRGKAKLGNLCGYSGKGAEFMDIRYGFASHSWRRGRRTASQ